jgi:hypothetical protein
VTAQVASLFARVRHFPPRRRRGSQPGNRNRLKHGGFSRGARARRERVRRLIRDMNFHVAQAKAWHTCDLKALEERGAGTAGPVSNEGSVSSASSAAPRAKTFFHAEARRRAASGAIRKPRSRIDFARLTLYISSS